MLNVRVKFASPIKNKPIIYVKIQIIDLFFINPVFIRGNREEAEESIYITEALCRNI